MRYPEKQVALRLILLFNRKENRFLGGGDAPSIFFSLFTVFLHCYTSNPIRGITRGEEGQGWEY